MPPQGGRLRKDFEENKIYAQCHEASHLDSLCVLGIPVLTGWAQPVFRNVFPPEEYAARRAKLFDKIGDSVAVLEGTTERPGSSRFDKPNQFFYLTGAAEPRAIALLDGRTHETTIFLLPAKAQDVSSKYGPGAFYPGRGQRAAGMEVHDVYGSYKTLEPGMVSPLSPCCVCPGSIGRFVWKTCF